MTKTCDVCNTEFDARGSAKRCSDACKKQGKAISNAKHAKTDRCKETQEAWNEANKEHLAEYKAAHREANKERKAETDAAWNEANKDRRAKTNAAYREENKEHIAKTIAAWARTPEGRSSKRAAGSKRRATKLNAESDGLPYTKLDHCVVCYSTENLTEEHLIALANGGTDTLMNKTTMCGSCNSSKGTRIDYRDPGYTVWIVQRRMAAGNPPPERSI